MDFNLRPTFMNKVKEKIKLTKYEDYKGSTKTV